MQHILATVFAVSVVTLMTELLLTRIFDYALNPNMAYMIITCAMFSFGLSGIWGTLYRVPSEKIKIYAVPVLILLGAAIVILVPTINLLPFDADKSPRLQLLSIGLAYLTLCVPFFISGLIINTVFTAYPEKIQSLYFWDLIGAALGCVIFLPFLPRVGPGGLLLCAAAVTLVTAALFCRGRIGATLLGAGGAIIFLVPFYYPSVHLDIRQYSRQEEINARGKNPRKLEFSRWDPVARIEVVDIKLDLIKKLNPSFDGIKVILYDSGAQASAIYPFDGDFQKLRANIGEVVKAHFNSIDILVPHYLKRDSGQKALIIGAAGGQEVKAALIYDAGYVDAVDMVGTVIELGKETYAKFNGNIFNHPNVRAHVAEGRSFLRSTETKYDIIQIISNHTTSSIAAGMGALNPEYLQTSDAYKEYFAHLTDNGILHIKHIAFQRMVTTAVKAWQEMGRSEFQKHVLVVANGEAEVQKGLFVKMQPWTEQELNELKEFLFGTLSQHSKNYIIVENPLNPEKSFLSKEFYSGNVSAELAARAGIRITPATDDRPYFAHIRKTLGTLSADPDAFVDGGNLWQLNHHVFPFLPRDIFPLVSVGVMSLLFAAVFVFVPLYFSRVGQLTWRRKKSSLFYFSCLGLGFIVIELTLIQILMHFIGYPLYTYSTVLFVLLLAAGAGSGYSRKLQINPANRWAWPFIGVLASGALLLATYSYVIDFFLPMPILVRIFVAALMIFPLGFFLGMPFPLGILWLEKTAQGAITWAWALNGLFTVVGGFLSVIISFYLGFKMTMTMALLVYLLAFWMFSRLRGVAVNPVNV